MISPRRCRHAEIRTTFDRQGNQRHFCPTCGFDSNDPNTWGGVVPGKGAERKEKEKMAKRFVIESRTDESGKIYFAATFLPMMLHAYGNTREEAAERLKEMFCQWIDVHTATA